MSKSASEFIDEWRVLTGSLVGISVGVSSVYFYSLGIFIKPIAAEFGWGRGQASLGALVGTAGAAIMAIPVGWLVDRIGSAKVAIGSICLLLIGFVSLGALTSGLRSFLAITFTLSVLTAGSSPLPYTRLIVVAFQRRRGLALGITLAGTGIGALLIPAFLTPFVGSHGWRAGYYALAWVCALGLPPVAWLLSRSGEPVLPSNRKSPLQRVLGQRTFWLLALIFFFASFAIFGTLVHFVPMLTDWGFTPRRAGATAGVIGLAAIGGRMLVGALLDRAPPLRVTAALFLMLACGLIALAVVGAPLAGFAAVLIGGGVGVEADLMAFLVARYYRKEQYGQVYGALYASFLLGGALGPAAAGYLQEATSDYRLSLYASSGVLMISVLCTWALARAMSAPSALTTAHPQVSQ